MATKKPFRCSNTIADSTPAMLAIILPCESTPKGVQTQRGRVFRKQNPHTARPKRDGGRWGI